MLSIFKLFADFTQVYIVFHSSCSKKFFNKVFLKNLILHLLLSKNIQSIKILQLLNENDVIIHASMLMVQVIFFWHCTWRGTTQ